MDVQEAIELYLASPRYDEDDIQRGFDPRAEPEEFARGLEAQTELHRHMLMRRYLGELRPTVIPAMLATTTRMLNPSSAAGRPTQERKDAIYQNAAELVPACGDEGRDALVASCADADPEVRALGAAFLGACVNSPPRAAIEAASDLLHQDADPLVRWAAAAAFTLWDAFPDHETEVAARLAMTDFAMRTMHFFPDAAAAHARVSAETSPSYANAVLFLRVLPQLLGTRN